MKSTEQKVIFGSQVVVIIYLVYCLIRLIQIDQLISSESPKEFIVNKINCRHTNSNIDIVHSTGIVNIPYTRDCYKLKSGDSILLYYSKEHDFFHIPGSYKYRNTAFALVGFLLWSIFPWRRLFKKFRS
jgi:hypothetical protein